MVAHVSVCVDVDIVYCESGKIRMDFLHSTPGLGEDRNRLCLN